MTNFIDEYALKARFYPCLLVLLPPFVMGVYYISNFEKYYHYFSAVLALGFFTFVLSQFGRDRGKGKEQKLFTAFGGKPTTQIMRFNDTHLDHITKERYRQLALQKIPSIQMPTAQEESANPQDADIVYDSCAKFLLSKTRDTTKFNLLFKENISYGFRRNLWAMKDIAIILIIFCLLTNLILSTEAFRNFSSFSSASFAMNIFLLFALATWILVITKQWIKLVAFSYAEKLFEALDEI